jgi:hypothetical protein
MKKILIYGLTGLSLFLLGCERIVLPSTEDTQPRIALMSSSRAALTSSTWLHYLEVWQGLSNDQKYAVWLEKLDETAELPHWNTAQRAKILEKKAELSPATFKTIMTDEDEIAMHEDLIPYFAPDQIERIFGHVYQYNHDITHGPINTKCTCLWSIYCGVMNTCDYGGCDISPVGCGFWGTSQCKGLCDNSGGL